MTDPFRDKADEPGEPPGDLPANERHCRPGRRRKDHHRLTETATEFRLSEPSLFSCQRSAFGEEPQTAHLRLGHIQISAGRPLTLSI